MNAPLRRFRYATLVLAMAAAGAAPVAAQEFSGGIRADLALASFRAEEFDQDRRTGIRIGVFGDLDLSGPVDIRGELVYVNKGTKAEGADEALELDYIAIPIAAKIALGDSPIYILAGPEFAFLVNSPFEGESADLLNSFDFGLLGGIGIDGRLGEVPVTFDVRYTTGFSTIFDFGPGDSDTDNRNQVISAGVGVKLF